MSTNHTPNYNLCQWEADDHVLRTDFNEDNAKIDAALASKAPAATVSSLQTAVNGKASAAALNSLQATVNGLSATVGGHTTALAGKGNCILYTTTYTGNGKSGAANKVTLTFPHRPGLVVVTYLNLSMLMVQGSPSTAIHTGKLAINNALTWSGNSVSWYCTDATTQDMMNTNGVTYRVVALLDAEH